MKHVTVIMAHKSYRNDKFAQKTVDRLKHKGLEEISSEDFKIQATELEIKDNIQFEKQTIGVERSNQFKYLWLNWDMPVIVIDNVIGCPKSCLHCELNGNEQAVIKVFPQSIDQLRKNIVSAIELNRAMLALVHFLPKKQRELNRIVKDLHSSIKKDGSNANSKKKREIIVVALKKHLEDLSGSIHDEILKKINDESFQPIPVFQIGQYTNAMESETITKLNEPVITKLLDSEEESYVIVPFRSATVGIIEKFKDHPNKSRLVLKPSLTPQEQINTYEPGNDSLEDRLGAVKEAVGLGYNIILSVSPLVYGKDFDQMISGFVEQIKKSISAKDVKAFSVGSLMLSRKAYVSIENLYPDSGLLTSELIPPKENPLKQYIYNKVVRTQMYSMFIEAMDKNGFSKVPRYLENETDEAWKALDSKKHKLDLAKFKSDGFLARLLK